MTFAVDQGKGKRPGVAVVAGIVGGAVLLATFMVVFALRSGGGATTDREAPGVPGSTAGPRRPADERLTAENVRWKDFAGASVPFSAAGPRVESGGRVSGFARSPAGAVLAASNLIYRAGSGGGPDIYRPTIADQVVGADKEKLLTNIEAEYNQARASGEPDPLSPAGIAKTRALRSAVWGYRVESFGPEAATINVLLRAVPAGGATYVNLALTVKWVQDDWRLVAPLNGQWQSVSRTVPAVPEGYTVLGRD